MSDGNHTDDDAPLPLSDLQTRVSQKTFQWLQAEEKRQISELEEEKEVTHDFFGFHDTATNDEEEKWLRVREWLSSAQNPDGIGGYNEEDSEESRHHHQQQKNEASPDTKAVCVKYILSSAGGGHGDDLWAASRHMANLFADEGKCRELLAPLLIATESEQRASKLPPTRHPLTGLNLIELGAGGGVPSWTAMWCGASVVCTDQSIPDRIRCLAESAERNRRAMSQATKLDKEVFDNACKARACGYDWGTSIHEVVTVIDGIQEETKFDIVVAADCIYMPEFHEVLLESIRMLLSKRGVALLPFALHGNTDDSKIWSIVDLASAKGFEAEVLESQQLTPQSSGMDKKRGLVHMLRLVK